MIKSDYKIIRSDGSTEETPLNECNINDFCDDFVINWLNKIDASCQHAALNGVGIKIKPLRYCPYCAFDFTLHLKK